MRLIIQAASAPNAQGRLVRVSDDTRSMMFEIVTQYRAVFSDDYNSEKDEGAAILHDWVMQSIEHYLATVSARRSTTWLNICFGFHTDLVSSSLSLFPVVNSVMKLQVGLKDVHDGAGLATVLTQTMYCGQSLGRVGADFRPLLAPLFESAVSTLYANGLYNALQRFRAMITEHNWATKAIGRSSETPATPGTEGMADAYAPPMEVLEYTPLAVFLNGILACHNELRFCCPLTLEKVPNPTCSILCCSCCCRSTVAFFLRRRKGRCHGSRVFVVFFFDTVLFPFVQALAGTLEHTLLGCVEALQELGGEHGAFLREDEAANFSDMARAFKDHVAPFSVRCLERCLGSKCSVDTMRVSLQASNLVGVV